MAKSLIDQLADAVIDLKDRVMGLEKRAERAIGVARRSAKSRAKKTGRAAGAAVRKVKAKAKAKVRKVRGKRRWV
jgi:uncharacterized protein YoxC